MPQEYTLTKSGPATNPVFTLYAHTKKTDVVIATGSAADTPAYEAACRLVLYANTAIQLGRTVERVNEIENSRSPETLL